MRKVCHPKSHPDGPTQTAVSLAANSFLLQPEWVTPLGPKGLFVADGDRFHLSDQIPHAIVKMYASATRHQCVRFCDPHPLSSISA